VGAREPADVALDPDDADLELSQLQGRVLALEDPDAGALEHTADVGLLALVPVVVSEHGEDRQPRVPDRVCQHLRLGD
jgi:hypothetical protein